MLKGYSDLADLPENERIRIIGETVMAQPMSSADKPIIIGIFVDDDHTAKRYIKKLTKRFPRVRIIDKGPGITPGSVLIRIGTPLP